MTKKQILKAIKKLEKQGNEYNLRYDVDADILFSDLGQIFDLNFMVYGRESFGDCGDTWLQCEYYSNKLKQTIIWNYDVGNFDDYDEVADYIIRTSKEIRAFEKRIILKK